MNLNLRDLFSAGGQWKVLDGKELETPYPAVLGRLKEVMPWVEKNLEPDSTLELFEFNKPLYMAGDRMEKWLDLVNEEFNDYRFKVNNRWTNFKDLKVNLNDILKNYKQHRLER